MDTLSIVLILIVLAIGYAYYVQYIRAQTATEAAGKSMVLATAAESARRDALAAKGVADQAAAEARTATNEIDAKNKILIAETAKAEAARLQAVALEAECKAQLGVLETVKATLTEEVNTCSGNVAELTAIKATLTGEINTCSSNVTELKSAKDDLTGKINTCSDNYIKLKEQWKFETAACAQNTAKLAAVINDLQIAIVQAAPSGPAQALYGVWYPVSGPNPSAPYFIFQWYDGMLHMIVIGKYQVETMLDVTQVTEDDTSYTMTITAPGMPGGSMAMPLIKAEDGAIRFGKDPSIFKRVPNVADTRFFMSTPRYVQTGV